MTVSEIERQLITDLESLGDRIVDEQFCSRLYRALARNTWSKRDGPDGHVALSFSRAEAMVNALRDLRGQPALTLAQTGDEGEVDSTVDDELGRLGWSHRPLNTSRHDEQHAGKPVESPPPKGTGEQRSPQDDSRGWERVGHEEAEAERRRQ